MAEEEEEEGYVRPRNWKAFPYYEPYEIQQTNMPEYAKIRYAQNIRSRSNEIEEQTVNDFLKKPYQIDSGPMDKEMQETIKQLTGSMGPWGGQGLAQNVMHPNNIYYTGQIDPRQLDPTEEVSPLSEIKNGQIQGNTQLQGPTLGENMPVYNIRDPRFNQVPSN